MLVFGAVLAVPQSSTTTTTMIRDLNGNRVEGQSFGSSTSPTGSGERTDRFQTINGRQVPMELVTSRVVREDANGKVTERIVQRFDRNGQAAGSERVMIEENKGPGGVSTVRETTYRTDLNGASREAERRTIETRVQGSTKTANIVVDRPTVNGSFETVEKRSAVTEGPVEKQSTTESVYRRDASGGFRETLRNVKTAIKEGDKTKETTANYEPGVNGQLQLATQTESTSTKLPDGSEQTQTNLFAQTVAGDVQERGAALRVKEQQVIQKRTNPDGSVVETLSVRRPTTSDPNRLGELQRVSETVCKGKCTPEPAKPAAEPAKP